MTLEPRFDQRDAYAAYRRPGPFPYRGVQASDWCVQIWEKFDYGVVQRAGLTDAILARTEMPPDRPGHKLGLYPLADKLAELQARYIRDRRGQPPRPECIALLSTKVSPRIGSRATCPRSR